MEKIDLTELRERVRSAYADHDAKDDPVLEFQKRNADIMADLAVALLKEVHERETPMADVLNGFVAIVSMALVNLCSIYKLNPEHTIGNVHAMLHRYIVEGKDTSMDQVSVPTRDVGDA